MTVVPALDPITLEIVWNGLRSVTDECFLTLQRSAFSTNIKERHDHSTAILDRSGRLIVQAEKSIPVHLASMTGLVKALVERFASDIGPDDIFVANDPHVAGGTHLPDINMAMPIFADGRLAGFICNIAHHADVGGTVKGSMSGGLTEIHQEGLRIPVVRLYHRGELLRDILDIMLLNMRLPTERNGDLNAQIASCRLGCDRMGQIFSKFGVDRVLQAFEDIVLRTRQRMELAINELPDGTWSFTDFMDDDGAGRLDVRIALIIKKSGQSIAFDFTGSDPQVPGNINLTLNAVQSAVAFVLKALLDPDMPNNQGVIDAIDIIAPRGSVVNCEEPGAVALRANTCQRVIDVVLGALSTPLPERVVGAANGANTSMVFAGIHPVSGKPYIYLETLGGGMGARAHADGKDGVQVHITNTSNLPVEAIEMEYPLRVEEYALVPDSGGAGRQRGGAGIRRVIRPVGHTCEFSGVGERFRHSPWGVFGAGDGKPGRFFTRRDGHVEAVLPGKVSRIALAPDTVVVVETPGAGGYGPANERAPEKIALDRTSGKFSGEFLDSHYPVSGG